MPSGIYKRIPDHCKAMFIVQTIEDRNHITGTGYPLSFNDLPASVEAIWERDHGTCQRCNKLLKRGTGNFVRHHKDFDETNSNPNNLILLCTKCHKYVHKCYIIFE